MVQSKTELFEQGLIGKAALFKALAHPAWLQILQFLAPHNRASPATFPMSCPWDGQPLTSI